MSKANQRKVTIQQDGYRHAQVGRTRDQCPYKDAADRWRWLSGFDQGLQDLRKRLKRKKRQWRQEESIFAWFWRRWYATLLALHVL